MESGLEKQINEFLEKFSNHPEDDFLYNNTALISSRGNMDELDGLEMTGTCANELKKLFIFDWCQFCWNQKPTVPHIKKHKSIVTVYVQHRYVRT